MKEAKKQVIAARQAVMAVEVIKKDLVTQRDGLESRRATLKGDADRYEAGKRENMKKFINHEITQAELDKMIDGIEKYRRSLEECSDKIFAINAALVQIEKDLPKLEGNLKSAEFAFWRKVFDKIKAELQGEVRTKIIMAHVALGKSGANYIWGGDEFFRAQLFGWHLDQNEVERISKILDDEFLK